MARSSFRIDEGGINELFNQPGGDVYEYIRRGAQRTVVLAKGYVGKNTGMLARSIDFRMLQGGATIYADNRVALMHHEGTRPHLIAPRRARALRFKSGGRVVYAQQVMHPGTRPNRYLVTALREVFQ